MILPATTSVVVAGASGAVGSAVVERLAAAGHRVRGLSRAELHDRHALLAAAEGAGVMVHCAGAPFADLAECRRANVDTTRNLVAVALTARCRFVYVSSVSAYDDAAGPSFDETSPLWTNPKDNPYGFTKAEAERIVRAGEARAMQAVILRPALVLSMHPRSRWGPLALERARVSDSSILPFPEVPHVHVDNLADLVVRIVETGAGAGRAYNVVDGAGDGASYLAAIYGAIGRPAPAVPADAPRLRFAADRVRAELGYAPVDRWPAFVTELGRKP